MNKNLASYLRAGLLALAGLLPDLAGAAITVVDDGGHAVTLAAPARRIVSLAPHATELLFAAGAGASLVGVSEYSNYPPPAKQITSVGSAAALDLERIAVLKPDLVLAWGSGNSAAQIARLKSLRIPVFVSEPRDFAAIASSLERIAQLAGTGSVGRVAAAAFRTRLQAISDAYANRPPVRVFYQIWREPLMTVNDRHMISTVLRLCGGRNIFGQLPQLAPAIGIEAVVQADPEAIIAGSSEQGNAPAGWQRFPAMTAVARGNLFTLDPDLLTRPGPRILEGAELLCRQMESARKNRR